MYACAMSLQYRLQGCVFQRPSTVNVDYLVCKQLASKVSHTFLLFRRLNMARIKKTALVKPSEGEGIPWHRNLTAMPDSPTMDRPMFDVWQLQPPNATNTLSPFKISDDKAFKQEAVKLLVEEADKEGGGDSIEKKNVGNENGNFLKQMAKNGASQIDTCQVWHAVGTVANLPIRPSVHLSNFSPGAYSECVTQGVWSVYHELRGLGVGGLENEYPLSHKYVATMVNKMSHIMLNVNCDQGIPVVKPGGPKNIGETVFFYKNRGQQDLLVWVAGGETLETWGDRESFDDIWVGLSNTAHTPSVGDMRMRVENIKYANFDETNPKPKNTRIFVFCVQQKWSEFEKNGDKMHDWVTVDLNVINMSYEDMNWLE